jgi:TRAP-type C4-dicarboxylate transport system substrate-binding protein
MASSRLAQLEAAQETAAQRAQAAEQRERELGAQLAAAQSEVSNSDEWSGAKGVTVTLTRVIGRTHFIYLIESRFYLEQLLVVHSS